MTKCTLLTFVAGLLCLAPAARAQPKSPRSVTGPKAKNLIRTIKFAGVKPTVAKAKWTYKVDALECTQIDEGNTEDGLDAGSCTLDKVSLDGDAAIAMAATLSTLGLLSDGGAGHVSTHASKVVCVVEGAGKWAYSCTWQ